MRSRYKFLSAKICLKVKADARRRGRNEIWKAIYTGYGRNGSGLARGRSYVVLKSTYKRFLSAKRNGKVKADAATIGR